MTDEYRLTGKDAAKLLGLGLAALVFLWFLFGSIRVVGVGQVGVVTRFGNVDRELQSGLHLKLPWPVERLHKFDVKTQKDQADAASASQDLQDVNATIVTNYHIEPGKVGELYRTVGTDYKVRIIDPAIQESVKATTAKYPVIDLITKRAEVKQSVYNGLRERLAPRGIVVEDVSLTNLAFSDAFTKAIEQKQIAEQQAQQARYNLERAQIDAQAQAAQKESLSPELLQKMAIERWDGHLPTATSGVPFINLPVR